MKRLALVASALLLVAGSVRPSKVTPVLNGSGSAPAHDTLHIGIAPASPDSTILTTWFTSLAVQGDRDAYVNYWFLVPSQSTAASMPYIMGYLGHPVAVNFSVFNGASGSAAARLPSTAACAVSWDNTTCPDDIASAAGTFAATYLQAGDYFLVGNEQILYLKTGAAGASKTAAYASLLNKIETAVRAACAGCLMGVADHYDPSATADLAAIWDTTYDRFGLTVYPEFVAGAPDCSATGAVADITALGAANTFIDAMGTPPAGWFVAETGICTSSRFGGSESIQAAWATTLRTWMTTAAGTLDPDFVNVFIAMDGDTKSTGCAANGASLAEYTCSLGVRRADFSAKPAYKILFP